MSDSGNHAEPTWFAHWPRLFIETLEVYAVFAVDLTGVILSWQPGVKRVLGYERENFVGQPSAIIFTEADQKAGVPEQELNTALQKGQALDERWHVHANGERFWGSGVTIAVRDNSDRVTGFAKLVRDRTSERLEDEVKDLTALRLEGSIVAQDEQIRLLAEDLTLAEQRERRRISQLLHDELQQQLYGLQMILGSVRGRATPDLAESLEEAYSLTKASVTLTRTFVSELDPHTLLGGAFDANLRWIASHMRERYSLEVTLEGEAYCPDLSKALSVLLLQCIQELLFNVVKHSGVKRADLTVEKTDTACTFTVHDKGRGFVMEPEDPNAPRQEVFGIQSVRRRLEPFGGTLQVNSKLGDGTQMTITLPNR